ncbi:hypothetical protein HNP55_001433 [Paucibacter oligotrophus]|uniref:Uncharacterized protein n=1 Tax=Roseateles oligotrophus TaxID=1769250 RepID=A0A840L9P6_9BURK|nr:hypothetical protein [Roseateles oligotrophus]MBB4842918.1 hypothetical protein [Roseateles oligotrophus]
MSLANSPKLLKGGLVVLTPNGSGVSRSIALQYNPDTLTRSYQVQGSGGDASSGRAQPYRLKGPAIETFRLDAEIDATDHLETPEAHASTVAHGIAPQLALLESLINPSVDQLVSLAAQSAQGMLEILPPEAPLVLFVWSKSRVVPVRVSEFSIIEQAFDPGLNPLRAKVSLGLRVLSSDDLGFAQKGASLFISHLRGREALAAQATNASLSTLGLNGLF